MKNHGLTRLSIILLSILLLYSLESSAVSPDPSVYGTKNADGQYVLSHPIPGMVESPSIREIGSAIGSQEIVVILVEFQDVSHSPDHDVAYFNDLLFSDSNPLSMRNYYKEVSYGQTVVYGVVKGWYRSSRDMAYYGADGDKRDRLNGFVYELAREAVQLADADGFDFSQYDVDHDGYVDHIIIIHAGPGQESGGGIYGPDAIWSHHWSIWPSEQVDGVKAGYYSMIAESSPMGTAAHEFGHDLGLPDLYDIDGSSAGIGTWGIMGYGSWLGGGNVPAHFCAWSKVFLGWITPNEITVDTDDLVLNCVEITGPDTVLRISLTTDEYFLLENRYNTGFDQYLSGRGVLIWHIDDSIGSIYFNDVNVDENHKRVDLEEADGRDDLDKMASYGDYADPYYMDNAWMFTPSTVPDSRSYSGDDSGVYVINIGDSGAAMTLDIRLGSDPVSETSINLAYGWNLISLCLQPLNTQRGSVMSSVEGKYDSIWAYDAAQSIWLKYDVDGPPFLNNLDGMESGMGYMVMMNQSGTLIVQGTTPAGWLFLKTGQNLVGYNFQTPISIDNCLSDAEGRISSIRTYDPQGDRWIKYNVHAPPFLNDLEFLEPGKGYWIDANEDFIWNMGN